MQEMLAHRGQASAQRRTASAARVASHRMTSARLPALGATRAAPTRRQTGSRERRSPQMVVCHQCGLCQTHLPMVRIRYFDIRHSHPMGLRWPADVRRRCGALWHHCIPGSTRLAVALPLLALRSIHSAARVRRHRTQAWRKLLERAHRVALGAIEAVRTHPPAIERPCHLTPVWRHAHSAPERQPGHRATAEAHQGRARIGRTDHPVAGARAGMHPHDRWRETR